MKLLNYILIFSSLAVFSQNEFKKKTLSGTALPTISQSAPSSSQSSLFSLPKPNFSQTEPTISIPKTQSIFGKKAEVDLSQSNTSFSNPYSEVIASKNKSFGNVELGKISTSTKFIIIKARDFSEIDGDKINIYLNGHDTGIRINLVGEYEIAQLDLTEGENIIGFFALNEGLGSPNTAEFKILDDIGKVIFENQWALSMGSIATVKITKE